MYIVSYAMVFYFSPRLFRFLLLPTKHTKNQKEAAKLIKVIGQLRAGRLWRGRGPLLPLGVWAACKWTSYACTYEYLTDKTMWEKHFGSAYKLLLLLLLLWAGRRAVNCVSNAAFYAKRRGVKYQSHWLKRQTICQPNAMCDNAGIWLFFYLTFQRANDSVTLA